MRTNHLALAIAVLLAALGTGCSHIGPGTIRRDRFDYGAAVGDSWKRETLLNIIKLRYADTPVFVEVSQIINQYELKGEVRLTAEFADKDKNTIGGTGSYIDRPTITYKPLVGTSYTRSLLTPVEPLSLVYLMRSGWQVDLLLRTCVSSINGLSNRTNRVQRPATLPQFYEVLEILERVQGSGLVGMRTAKRDDRQEALLFFRQPTDDAVEADLVRLKELLGLNPEANEFEIVFGNMAENDRQIALLTRSVLEIMLQFSGEVEVPPKHAAEGRVFPGLSEDVDRLLRVHSGREAPSSAFAKVHYRGYVFWIDDRDFVSKRYFLFLNILFSLVETGVKGGGAVLTVSAGG